MNSNVNARSSWVIYTEAEKQQRRPKRQPCEDSMKWLVNITSNIKKAMKNRSSFLRTTRFLMQKLIVSLPKVRLVMITRI